MEHDHKHFVEGCSRCELNRVFVQVVTREKLSEKTYNAAQKAYRERDLEAMRAL